jgi:hypothetical protein
MTIFHQLGEHITSIISMAWYFTTRSDGMWENASQGIARHAAEMALPGGNRHAYRGEHSLVGAP